MPIPSNGITEEVIRDIMHPYHLSADLLEATLATIPAPPPDAPTTWRLARLTRLADEIAAPKPANAEQARIAAEILITRELANALAHRAHAPGRTDEQMCRLARTTDRLLQTAVSLGRSLARLQQNPSPFFGIVVQDEVDLPALDATWHTQPQHPDAAPPARSSPTSARTRPPTETARRPPRRPTARHRPLGDDAATPTNKHHHDRAIHTTRRIPRHRGPPRPGHRPRVVDHQAG